LEKETVVADEESSEELGLSTLVGNGTELDLPHVVLGSNR